MRRRRAKIASRTVSVRTSALVVLGAVAAVSLSAGPAAREAHADEAPPQTADWPKACREFEERNERELKLWSKLQPDTPYEYPRPDTIGGAPWGGFLKSVASTGDLLIATIVPSFGAQLRLESPAAVVSFPWSLPFGPAFSCSRRAGSFDVMRHQAHRVMLEPGIVGSNRGVGFFVRPGYRFILHPSDWVVGVGGGVGSTVEMIGNREPFRASVSPEVLAHFGHCCDRDYFILSFRYDRFFGGTALNVFGANLGFVYF